MTEKKEKKSIVSLTDLKKSFDVGDKKIAALRGVDLEVFEGDFLVIFGPSGCGKSTLLNILIGLEEPTSGLAMINGKNIYALGPDERGAFRGKIFGIMHQRSYWVQSLTILENVALPLIVNGMPENKARDRAREVLESLKISNMAAQKPGQLSGGEQQKVACARALVNDPDILIADEPTGNLDTASADSFIATIHSLNRGWGKTIILVTHNPAYVEVGNRRIQMVDGKISKQVSVDKGEIDG